MGAHQAVTAIVLEELPQAKYRVKLENQQVVIAHPVGLAGRNFVRLVPGDRVEVELAPDDWTRGRIVRKVVSSQSSVASRKLRAES